MNAAELVTQQAMRKNGEAINDKVDRYWLCSTGWNRQRSVTLGIPT